MTQLNSDGHDRLPEDLLLQTDQHFTRSVVELNTTIEKIKTGEHAGSKELTAMLTMLGKALQSALDERVRVEKLRKQSAGIVYDYALDFESARTEIGRRLARLRAAEHGGSVPGGAE